MTQKKTQKETQSERVLNYLLSGKSLTSLEAITKFQCLRLAGRIKELRQHYKIHTEMIVTKSKKRIAKYSIIL